MANEPKKDVGPQTPGAAHKMMMPRWERINALLGGTEAMRAAGETLMPRHRREFEEDYKRRLSTNVLVNYFEWTLESLVSKPFAEDPKIELPSYMEEFAEDVDLQGNALAVFLRNWFRSGYAKGVSGLLIEFPRIKPREDGQPRTLDDDRKENLRPYWVDVAPENIIFAHAEMVNGVEMLTHLRVLEEETVVEGWEEKTVKRVRVLRPGSVELYKFDGKKYSLEDSWDTGLDIIPFVAFYSNGREDVMVCKPPLQDLAFMNVAHWQSSSDQRNVLTVSRFPMLAGSGLSTEDADALVVGPNRLLTTTDPQGKFYYVEHNGAAISAGQTDLDKLEEQMMGYGATFLKAQPGSQTATARALDSAEAVSPLQATVMVFEDAVAQALLITAQWMKKEDGGTVEFNKEFGLTLGDQAGLEVLFKARQAKDISRKTFLDELKRRALLSGDFDADEDQEALDEEAANGMPESDLDPVQPKEDPNAPPLDPNAPPLDPNGPPKAPAAPAGSV